MAPYVVVTTEFPPMDQPDLNALRKQGIYLVESYENYVRVLQGMGVSAQNIIRIESYVEDICGELRKVRELCEIRNLDEHPDRHIKLSLAARPAYGWICSGPAG